MIGYVIAGGAVGALIRFMTERWSVHRFHERIPYGTLIVNLGGSLILGIAVGLHEHGVLDDGMLTLVGTGFCGALTTFSGWIGQIHSRGRHRDTRMVAVTYLVVSLIAGFALASVGYHAAR